MLGNNPLVSVIIPAYNHQKYVQETIESVINQTYQNLELIIIDDGSKDNTWQKIQEILENCKKRFNNLVVQKQQNQGTSIVLNKALTLCKGKYVAVIASDDVYLPFCLEEQVKVMEENPNIVQTLPDNISIDGEGRTFKGFEWDKKFFTLKSDYWLARYPSFNLLSEDFHSYKTVLEKDLWSNGFLWRKDALDKFFPIPTVKMSEDYFINLQLAKLGLVKFINKPLFLYRVHNANTLNNKEYMNFIGTNVRIEEIKTVLKPSYKKWKEILKETWFKEKIKSFGFKNFCIQRIKSEFESKRRLKFFNCYFTFYRRKRYQIPDDLLKQIFY